MRFLSFRKPRWRQRNERSHLSGNSARSLLVVLVLFGACAFLVVRLDSVGMRNETGAARVVDGDTVVVGGQRIRLSGIDAFEIGQTCTRDGAQYDCGQQSRSALAKLIGGRPVRCEGNRMDRYNRLLAVCYAGEAHLNHAMVNAGWALSYGAYRAPEIAARLGQRGAWAGGFDAPSDWRVRKGGLLESPHDIFNRTMEYLRDSAAKLLD